MFLTGFMAAGKTSVGRAIAQATGRRFVDLDDEIAALGEPVASLVARDEPELRRRESETLDAVIRSAGGASDGLVVATGGGAATFGDNLARMRRAGLVVALGVDVAEAARRAAGGPPRPLLDAGPGATAALAARRAPLYRAAHAVVDTTAKPIDVVIDEVLAVEARWQRLPPQHRGATIVSLLERSYPIVVHDGVIDGALVNAVLGEPTKIALITDHLVAAAWLSQVIAALPRAEVLQVEPGEASKSLAVYERLCTQLVANGLDRSSAIVALGGGVVGDLAGFVAATLYRGVPIVHIPTTLVAMTDSAIGGKTAVDLPAGKNLVGAFHQPRLVACGLETLTTLPARQRRAGFGELWKYALLDGAGLWAAVARCASWAASETLSPPPPELRTVIDRSIAYKAAIVGRDEREQSGHRALLNLGHTVGHAIETAAGGQLLHGEAVALGLMAACRVSVAVAGARESLTRELTEAIQACGLSTDLDPWLTDAVLERILVDKKRVGATVRFVVVKEVGGCEVAEIDVTELFRILRPGSTA